MERKVAVPLGRGADPLPWGSLADLVDDAARRHGARQALRDGHHVALTFEELAVRTRAVAEHLRERGLRAGDRVALMMANTLDWPVLWLAVVRAGGVAVPVNRSYRTADLRHVLSDSRAAIVAADDDAWDVVREALDDELAVRMVLDPAGAADAGVLPVRWVDGSSDRVVESGWEGVANLQYTSGTTGFPKACVLREDYWLRAGWLTAQAAELGDDDVVLTTQPYSYIDPQWHTVMCLVAGATLVVLPRFSARRYWPAIREHKVTFAYVLGTMPVILYKQPPSDLDRRHRVRLMLCSGIPADLHAAFEERWGAPWREAYGMTETAIDLVAPSDAAHTVGSGVAGRVVETKAARVVAEGGVDVADDEVGELWLRGEPMMTGYHERPRETADTVVDGWLRTGDLVSRDADGWIRVVGRLKDMVRRAGENIAAAEVEGVVAGHPDVAMSAVVAVPDDVTEEEVKIFVQLNEPTRDPSQTARSIIDHARARLADFKVPRFVEFVDGFERTPSERVVKASLSRPDQRVGAFDVRHDRWGVAGSSSA